MKGFYVRWGAILLAGVMIALLGAWRYEREVTTISPEDLLLEQPTGMVRILGRVQPGSLMAEEPQGVRFELAGDRERILVRYTGEENDNLRELKTLVVVGRWNPGGRELEADEIALVPNYGFIAAAYLLGIVPVMIFLFGMERRTRLLFHEIKGTTVYKPEEGFDNG